MNITFFRKWGTRSFTIDQEVQVRTVDISVMMKAENDR